MKKSIWIILYCGMFSMNAMAQEIKQDEIKITCYVLSELMADAVDDRDDISMNIYSNAFMKIQEKYQIEEKYTVFFNSIRDANRFDTRPLIISLKDPPSWLGFTSYEIEGFEALKLSNVSAADLDNFMALNKIKQGTIEASNLGEMELKKLEAFKKEIQSIKVEY